MAQLTGFPASAPFDSTWRSTTAPGLPLGTRALDASGNEYTFVKAGAAIAALDAVRFAGSATGWDDIRPTSAAQQFVVGIADGTAFAEGEYGFIKTGGIGTVKVTNSTAVGSLLVSSSTAGLLSLAVATDLAGARSTVALTTGGSSATAGAVVALG